MKITLIGLVCLASLQAAPSYGIKVQSCSDEGDVDVPDSLGQGHTEEDLSLLRYLRPATTNSHLPAYLCNQNGMQGGMGMGMGMGMGCMPNPCGGHMMGGGHMFGGGHMMGHGPAQHIHFNVSPSGSNQ